MRQVRNEQNIISRTGAHKGKTNSNNHVNRLHRITSGIKIIPVNKLSNIPYNHRTHLLPFFINRTNQTQEKIIIIQ